jgi:ribosome-associated protein
MKIHLATGLAIDEEELVFEYVRATGPGGQNVNKVATAVQLRFDVRHSTSLPADVGRRLERLAGRRMTADGVLILLARNHRTQEQNRAAALARLSGLAARAARPPKSRRPTKPSAASRERRLESKKRHGMKKRNRREEIARL